MLLQLPDSLVITSIDAEKHELVGPIAAEVSQLIGLTLWLMAERAKGGASAWAQLLQTLPDSTASPILWEDQVGAVHLCGCVFVAACTTVCCLEYELVGGERCRGLSAACMHTRSLYVR